MSTKKVKTKYDLDATKQLTAADIARTISGPILDKGNGFVDGNEGTVKRYWSKYKILYSSYANGVGSSKFCTAYSVDVRMSLFDKIIHDSSIPEKEKNSRIKIGLMINSACGDSDEELSKFLDSKCPTEDAVNELYEKITKNNILAGKQVA